MIESMTEESAVDEIEFGTCDFCLGGICDLCNCCHYCEETVEVNSTFVLFEQVEMGVISTRVLTKVSLSF